MSTQDAEKSERGPVAPALPPPPPGNHLPTAGPTLDTIVEKVEPTETPAASQETPISHDDLDFVGEPTNEFTRQDLLEVRNIRYCYNHHHHHYYYHLEGFFSLASSA